MNIPEYIVTSVSMFQPEIVLVVGFCLALLVDLFARRSRLAVPIVALASVVGSAFLIASQPNVTQSIFTDMYAIDAFSVFFKYIVLGTSALIVIFSMQSKELHVGRLRLGEYYALLLAMTLGMMLMTGATNLLMMYLALELTSISSYILAGYTKEEKDSSEAALKYVIFGAVASGLMLYGISILFGLTGALDIYGINSALSTGDVSALPLILAGVLLVVGFGYKISAVPFHFWTPDVYEGAPITITAFLSVASKAAGFAMMMRFFKVSFLDPTIGSLSLGTWVTFQGFEWNQVVAIISVLTMTLGNLVAIHQKNMKRLLAYSSIAHAGYMLLGVVVLSNQGISAVMIYFAVYMFMNLGAFYVVMLVANIDGREDIDAYKGLGYRSPIIGVAMTLFLLSLTGIPPTAGFVGKLYIFAALMSAKWFWLALIGVLNSVVSLYYYVRVLRNMFLVAPPESAAKIKLSFGQLALLFLLLLPTVVLGLYFTPLVEYAQASVTMFGVK